LFLKTTDGQKSKIRQGTTTPVKMRDLRNVL